MSPVLQSLPQDSGLHIVLVPRKGGGGGGGRGGGARGSSGAKGSSTSVSASGRGASSFSKGGGKTTTVSSGPFTGREVGGGTRGQVYGTSQYGSGYPYGAIDSSTVAGRPFPFGFWPIYVSPNQYGSDEYGPSSNSSRPGGAMSTILIVGGNVLETYHIIGDQESVSAVMTALQNSCEVAPSGAVAYDLTVPGTSLPGASQIIQYYRASSFALALDSYNNTSTDPASPTPLPTSLDLHYLSCLNSTIAAAVPILDGPHKLTGIQIAWIVLGSIEGLLLIIVLISCAFPMRLKARPAPKPYIPAPSSSPSPSPSPKPEHLLLPPLEHWPSRTSDVTIVSPAPDRLSVPSSAKGYRPYSLQPHVSQ